MQYAIVTLHHEIGMLEQRIISCKAHIGNGRMGFYDIQTRENFERDLALSQQRIPELKNAIKHLENLNTQEG
jgi:hypothetical protein